MNFAITGQVPFDDVTAEDKDAGTRSLEVISFAFSPYRYRVISSPAVKSHVFP